MNVDAVQTTVVVSFLAFLGGLLIKGLRVLMDMNDTIKSLVGKLGSKNPPDGVLGAIEELKVEVNDHRDWLVRNGYDRRSGHDRRK